MRNVSIVKNADIATLVFNRGKVNALNPSMVQQIQECLAELEKDTEANALILTGSNKNL